MARSPLFNIYDPSGLLQQQAAMGMLPEDEDEFGLVEMGRRRPQLADLMPPEEQRSMLGDLAARGSSGLAGLGWLLDTPGAVVRGGLSGGLGKALSALWETSDDRVTGRELLRQYGMADEKDNWGNFGGGLAAEVLLDPLTYMSFGLNQLVGTGAKTFAGKAAAKAGLLDDFDVFARGMPEVAGRKMGTREAMRKVNAEQLLAGISDDAVREAKRAKFLQAAGGEEALTAPLAKMNRVGLPFAEGAYDLLGEQVGDAVARLGDNLGEGLATNKFTGPAVRGLTAAFDPSVMGMTDYQKQLDARGIRAAEKARAVADRTKLAELQFNASKALAGQNLSLNDQRFSEAFATVLEKGAEAIPDDLRGAFSAPEVQQLVGYFDNFRQEAIQNAAKLGVPLDEFTSRAGIDFFPRQQASFDVAEAPKWPAGTVVGEREKRPYSRGNRPVMLTDNYGRSRKAYTDVSGGRETINRMSLDAGLQEALRSADAAGADKLLSEWAQKNIGQDLYSWVDNASGDALGKLDDTHPLMQQKAALKEAQDNIKRQMDAADVLGDNDLFTSLREQLEQSKSLSDQLKTAMETQLRGDKRASMVGEMADFLRTMDPQHARKGVPIFGQNSVSEMARYVLGRGRVEAQAEQMLQLMKREMQKDAASSVAGGVNYDAMKALETLGFTNEAAPEALKRALGVDDLTNVSFNKKFIDDWSKRIKPAGVPEPLNPLLQAYDDFTGSFKTLALLWPSRYTRDLYSGGFAAAMKGSYNPVDRYAGRQLRLGNYDPLVKPMLGGLIRPRLAGVPGYDELLKTDAGRAEAVRKFLTEAGGQGVGVSTAADELGRGANTGLRGLYPGAATPGDIPLWKEDNWYDNLRNYWPFATRGPNGNRNPVLEYGDRLAEMTDATNRFGTYLTQIRKGADPSEAARITNLTQVNYSPEAFTEIEREILKRIVPFYSYSKGITPLIGDELMNRPAGLMGQAIRSITRGSAPTEDNFTPDYLRQSAAIPLDAGVPFIGLGGDSGLKRYLTNIDLPFESVINLFTPGVGNTTYDAVGSTLQKTALNLLGQTNPLIKGPLELATNRQFYSGRQLSDLYSMFEQTMGSPGRFVEQVAVNAPGGSRIVGAVRQAMDDRLDTREKWSKFAVNALTGLKLQDVDQERTRRLAARDMLNQLLETTPGVRTYENITVPEDVLQTMPEEQRRQYLLYKIVQAEAAKRARDKKKQEAALDPLQVLGVIQ